MSDKPKSNPSGGVAGASGTSGAGAPTQGGAAPPYLYEGSVREGSVYLKPIPPKPNSGGALASFKFGPAPTSGDPYAAARAQYGSDAIYPPASQTDPQVAAFLSNTGAPQPPVFDSSQTAEEAPYDSRLLFLSDVGPDGKQNVIYSFSSNPSVVANLVDGFVYKKPDSETESIVASDRTDPDAKTNNAKMVQFQGVPAIMNELNYINLQGAGGSVGNKLLRETENEPRWYDKTSGHPRKDSDGKEISATAELTVKDLIAWSKQTANIRFPYRFQDFVFCKWWKKVPLNYMVTLRRYSRPVIDSVGSEFDKDYDTPAKATKMIPTATAVTFLGEDPGNKISSILGNIEAGLKWKDVKADVWQVTTTSEPSQADSPFPGLAKLFALLNGDPLKPGQQPMQPVDPYSNGPYANKIIGPVTVIDSTKGRERGITFKHEVKLQFEYVARSIGGINPKAAMLDIISHFMVLTFNTAAFWGGENRYMPHAGHARPGPFLGGPEGRAAFLAGNPEKFFQAVMNQFSSAMDVVGDFFKDLMGDPVSTLMGAANKGMKAYMKLNTTQGRSQTQGVHSLLTGAPVGEWHVTVGNPMNPMMMIGNLVCSGVKIEFSDELGPDDFPMEVKFTVTLEHGMPRDKSGIESMFNKGQGRLYALPDGRDITDTFASFDQSAIDKSLLGQRMQGDPKGLPWQQQFPAAASVQRARDGVGASYNAYRGGAVSTNPLIGDQTQWDALYGFYKQAASPRVRQEFQAVYSNGTKPPPKAASANAGKTQ